MLPVSVIIPLYNKRPYIRRALESVLAQTFQNFEVLVIDDGSQDGSADEARVFTDQRIRIITQENVGVSIARNRGITESTGALVAFLDADDEWQPNLLATLIALNERFPDAGALGTAYVVEQSDGIFCTPAFPHTPTAPTGGLLEDYFIAPHLWTSATAVLRKVLDDVGGFQPGIRYGEDMDLWVRIALKYPIAWSPTVNAVYHTSEETYNCRGKFYVGDAPFAEQCELFYSGLDTDHQMRVYEFLCSQRLRTFAVGTYLAGHCKLARTLIKACKYTRSMRNHYIFLRCLTALPVSVGRAIYRLVRHEWHPWQFVNLYHGEECEGF